MSGGAPGRAGRALALGLALGLVLGAGPVAADRAAELQRLRDAIAAARERVTEYERRERGLLEALEALDRSVALLEVEVARTRRAADAAQQELARVEAEAEDLEARLAATQRAMSARAVALYKSGQAGAVRVLFSAGELRDFMGRVQSLRLLLGHDAELLGRYRAESVALADARVRAREAAERHAEVVASLRERRSQLAGERGQKRRLAKRLHEDRARERGALVELETAARALEETLAALGAEDEAPLPAAAGPDFAGLRGRLRPPVVAPVREPFGRVVDPTHQTETFRNGVSFAAPLGTPVRAVAAGRVRFAGWFRGYGRLLILDHGDEYFSVCGHLGALSVEVGDAVAAGQAVAAVGDTGSLEGPQLYFEIRRAGSALDPETWLKLDGSRNGG